MNQETNTLDAKIGNAIFPDAKISSATKWEKFPGIPIAFPFEENFDAKYHIKWFKNNWTLSIYISIAYISFVYFGTKVMKNREKFDLRLPLTVWSLILCFYSLASTIRLVPELWNTYQNLGFKGSILDVSYRQDNRIIFWIWLFIWSKVIELGDTVFIILRKQKLIFLHWYHHFTTLTFCFLVFHQLSGRVLKKVFTSIFTSSNYSSKR